jgi:hypothetical protein
MKHPLGYACAAAVVIAATSSAAHAQSPAPSAAEEARSPGPAESKPTNLWLLDGQFTTSPIKKSVLESWLSGVDVKCVGCGPFGASAVRPGSTNANAPWLLQGHWRRQTPLGRVSMGFAGVRNYAIPLSTATPIGGEIDLGPLAASSGTFSGPTSQWSLTAAFEKTLKTFPGGASVGVTADVLIPINTASAVGGDPRVSAMGSRAIRAGIVIRW